MGDKATVISVGIKHIKINCLGIDLNLRIDDLAYGYIQDVNDFYSVGDVIPVKILEIDKENNKLKVSAKELLEDPYKNIRIYFTEGGEYVGTITGYAPNGVYIKLMQGVDAAAIIPIWMNKSPNNDLFVRDEENHLIYSGAEKDTFEKYCKEHNLNYVFGEYDNEKYFNNGLNWFPSFINKDSRLAKLTYNMYSEGFPKSKKLYFSFSKITITEHNDFNVYSSSVSDTGFEIGVIINNIERPECPEKLREIQGEEWADKCKRRKLVVTSRFKKTRRGVLCKKFKRRKV